MIYEYDITFNWFVKLHILVYVSTHVIAGTIA
jgi:hypothetical protein